jgi:hypothetical protein
LFLIEHGTRGRPSANQDLGATLEMRPSPERDQGNRRPDKGRGKGKSAKEKREARLQAKANKKKGTSKGGDKPGTTADGRQLCFTWNRHEKGCVDGPCPAKRVHLC